MNANRPQCRTIKFGETKVMMVALMSASMIASTAFAQSGTRTAVPRNIISPGSRTKTVGNRVSLQGYCPVCVVKMKKWIKGNPQFSAVHDGKTYLFPGEEQKQMFLSDPAQYTPVLGGDCVVALVEMRKRAPGNLNFGAVHNDRLFLFSNEKAKEMFLANKAKYANADLALGGKCSVCRVEMNQDVAGKSDFTTIYGGLRYQFPGKEQQQRFNQNPAKYDASKLATRN